jgi:hypothetical protein
MSKHPGISSLVTYGTEGEQLLTSLISVIVGERVTKTAGTFDTMDFAGASSFSELKRRSSDWFYTDEKIQREGWLMPTTKVMKGWEALSEGKRVYFFYFWMRDKSLWMYEMKEGDFNGPNDHNPPKNHYDNQLHVTIQQDRWTRCNVDCSSIVFEEDSCWIE